MGNFAVEIQGTTDMAKGSNIELIMIRAGSPIFVNAGIAYL